MNAGTSVFAGVAAVISGLSTVAACTGPVRGGSTDYTEATPITTSLPSAGAAAPAITAATVHPAPQDTANAAAVPPPAATIAVADPPPPAAAAAPASAPAAANMPATTPASTTVATTPTTTKPAGTGWNAGSGTALPDGKTIEYHIPDGTGGKDWNPKDNPIRVRRGMVLRLVDDDKSTRAGGHWLHTNGQPCTHGLKAIGQGFDCNISMTAPTGLISGVFEHNVANGIGQLYIEVVADAN